MRVFPRMCFFSIWPAGRIPHWPRIRRNDGEVPPDAGATLSSCPIYLAKDFRWGGMGCERPTPPARDLGNPLGNLATRDNFAKLVYRGRFDTPFGQFPYLAFISALRTQPEGAPARRTRAGDELLMEALPDSKSTLDLRDVLCEKRIVLNYQSQNDRRVSILTLPCFVMARF